MITGQAAVLIAVLSSFKLVNAVSELPKGIDRKVYCGSCLATVRELKIVLNSSAELSKMTVKAELRKVCQAEALKDSKLLSVKACKHLIDSYEGQFVDALLTKKEDRLEAVLCYEHTMACTGLKRENFRDQTQGFQDGVIQDILKKNSENVRHVKPVHPDSTYRKDEL